MGDDPSKRRLFDWEDRIFDWEDHTGVSDEDTYVRREVPRAQLALTGPSLRPAQGQLPVRGDLAHVRLAPVCFVPHYAAPMPHRVRPPGAVLRAAADPGAEELCALRAGATFDVLDIAGGWCWGELGEGGPVGYVEQAALEALAP